MNQTPDADPDHRLRERTHDRFGKTIQSVNTGDRDVFQAPRQELGRDLHSYNLAPSLWPNHHT